MKSAERELIEGVYRHRLVEAAQRVLGRPSTDTERALAQRAIDTCSTIEQRVRASERELQGWLHESGIDVAVLPAPVNRQYHTIHLRVADFDVARAVVDSLVPRGFEQWETWTGAAQRSFRHHATQLTLARTTDVTMVVRVGWRDPVEPNVVSRALTPTAGDWGLIDLPAPLWRLYSLVRPLRLVAERLGLRRRNALSLGPYLATPESLIDGLAEFAELSASDLVVDLGCGDGRIVVDAVRSAGCRGIGVETSSDLVVRARQRAEAAGVADRVDIVEGDARDASLADATVVYMFLPVTVVSDIIEETIARLPRGARLIVHEQNRLPIGFPLEPDQTTVLLDEAVTVAHRFDARG